MVMPLVKRHDRLHMMRPGCLAVILVACGGGGGSSKPAIDPASTTGPGLAGIQACKSLVRAIDATHACAPSPDERRLAERSLDRLRAMYTSTEPIEPTEVEMHATACLDWYEELSAALTWQKCKFEPTSDERAWMAAFRKHRTGLPKTMVAGSLDALKVVMEGRDKVCACKDLACADQAMRRLETDLRPLPTDASIEERDAGGKMLDEAARCQKRLRRADQHAKPPPPSDPAAARELLDDMEAAEEAENTAAAAAVKALLEDGGLGDGEAGFGDESDDEEEQPGSDVVVPFK